MIVLAAMMMVQAAAPPAPAPGLVFGFDRMLAFQQRDSNSGCGGGDLDAELVTFGKRLVAPFLKQLAGSPGDCGSIVTVYRVNMADFRKEAAAALAASAPIAVTQE